MWKNEYVPTLVIIKPDPIEIKKKIIN